MNKMFSSEVDPLLGLAFSGLPDLEETGEKDKGVSAGASFPGSKFSMKELKNMQEAYIAEARKLQQEVSDLEDDLEAENMAALSIPSETLDLLRDILKMKKEEGDILDVHDMQSSLSGVQLTDATTHVTSNNPHHTIRLQKLEGKCSELRFAASFEVEETLVKQNTEEEEEEEANGEDSNLEVRKAVIRKLDLEVDPCCLGEIVNFLSEAEKSCDLQPFLRGYADYARWYQHRVRIFSHFKKEYPETVILPDGQDGSILEIMCPQQKGIIYMIRWKIDVARSGKCSSDVSLSVKSAKEASKLDTKKVLNRAPEEFKNMVDILGVEKALAAFLNAVALK